MTEPNDRAPPEPGDPEERGRRAIWTGVVVAGGVVLAAVEAVHVQRMLALVGPLGVVLESVLPLVLSIVLIGVGGWLHRSGYSAGELRRIVGWMAVGSTAVGLLFAWSLSHQYVAGGRFPHAVFVMGTNVVVGTLLGTVVGVYDVRTRRHRAALQGQHRTVQRNRTALAFLNRELRHHVLNGMNVVQGALEGGRGEDADLDGVRGRVDDVVDTVHRVGTVTRALDPRTDPQLEARDLSTTVHVEAERLRATSDADVTTDLEDGATVLADDLLPSVVENLLANAVEHSDREHPAVEASVSVDGGTATLQVADDGPGIDDAERALLEDWPETPPDEVGPGVGIGFAIVRTAIERYGGTVRISQRDPRGTVVEVSLPTTSEEPADAVRSAVAAGGG